jgi:hypothetical protein
MNRLIGVFVLALSLSGVGCAPVDLSKALSVTDMFTGWHFAGIVEGQNKMVPSVMFKLSNVGDTPINRVQLLVSFWQAGADGEIDSKTIEGIGPTDLVPASATEVILVRSDFGYTLAQPKEELFENRSFQDFSVRLFARRDGRLIPLGEFPIDRRIIPSPNAANLP